MKTRQQTRLSNTFIRELDIDTESQTNATSARKSLSRASSPRQKKRAVAKAPPNKQNLCANSAKRERLTSFLSLPIDLFTEIASYLAPPEIISLSRSNKILRGILMHRSAARIWSTSLRNISGLPPCPEDLCEPQYAALVFSKYCSSCGTPVARQMNPFLHVRLCNACRNEQIIDVDEVDPAVLVFIPQSRSLVKNMCLLSDKDDVEKMYKKLFKPKGKPLTKYQAWAEERIRLFRARREHAIELEAFLENMADMRLQELEELKTQRRNSIKCRLTEAGWEESDWTFPWQIARKWTTLVEDPKPLTDRIWQNLYPKMVPYLEKNREFQTARFKADRRRRRNRRMRALLIEIQKRDIVLKVDRTVLRGETPAVVNHLEPYYDSDGGLPSEAENEAGHTIIFAGNREPLKVVISRPFPPMTDALALPIIQELLEDDTDTNTLEDRFEESREEVEEVLRSWGDTVERELVDMLKSGVDPEDSEDSEGEDERMEPESDSPPLDLQFEVPSEYASFPDALKPGARLLLRADSVFRVDNDQQAPLPLYYPELFAILQDRTCGYFGNIFDYVRQTRPKLGYKWDSSQVKSYPEGAKAAKVLLKELGRPNATQFELQALGPRFTCGLCADKWVRNWNEMVQHYAEAFIHARLAEECTEPAKDSIVYNNLHVLDPASRSKGKNKPILVFHTATEAKTLTALERWDLRVQVKCNFCTDLGIEFLAPRQVMPKHIRAVHEFKTPRAEHRTKVYEKQEHIYIHTHRVKPRISDSSSEDEEADAATMTERARAHGMAVYWSEWISKGLESYDD